MGGGNPSFTARGCTALPVPTHLAPREPGPGKMLMELASGEPGSREPFAPRGLVPASCLGYQTWHTGIAQAWPALVQATNHALCDGYRYVKMPPHQLC
jgi:hypothetical protein